MKASAGNRVLMLLATSLYPRDPRVQREATSLVHAGYDVSVICPRFASRVWQPLFEVIDGVHIYRYPVPTFLRSFSAAAYVMGYIYSFLAIFIVSLGVFFRRGFDVVHIHNPPDVLVFVAAFYKLLFGKCFVYDHHDLAPEMYGVIFKRKRNRLFYKVLVWLEKLCCRFADHVIATNQSYRQMEIDRGHVPADRITIVRNGPELNVIKLVEPDQELRQKGKVILGYVGAMGLHDGVDYMLRTLQHLVRDLGRTDFFCVLVGRGKMWNEMKLLSQQLGLTDYVWFTGFVPLEDLLRYLSTADICLAPEPKNAFNDRSTMIKVTEYLALGKPIVAFDLTEHRFTAQEAAVYATPNDELDFARKIAWLMDNPEQGQKMGQIGRKRAEKELAWSYQVKHLVGAYESLKR